MTLVDTQGDVYSVSFTYPFLDGIDPAAPPATISIPNKYLDAMASMERQYWGIKSSHYNIIIFFKKGKFYELYDYDAVIANREFGLKMVFDTTNRGKMRLAGVPEQSYNEWARLFVFRGYKVGRVEQMKEENEAQGIKAKVVHRELVEVLTPGTVKDPSMLSDHREVFVLSLMPVLQNGQIEIDAFAVDLSRRVAYHCPCRSSRKGSENGNANSLTGEIKREQKIDGFLNNTILRALSALLQQLNPKEVIMTDNGRSFKNIEEKQTFQRTYSQITKWTEGEGFAVECIPSNAHGSPPLNTIETAEGLMVSYFTFLCLKDSISIFSAATDYTAHLTESSRVETVAETSDSLFDHAACSELSILSYEHRFDKGLVLDSNTVCNLEILTNLHDGSEKQSLNECLNHCRTNGGRRLFRAWLLRPSSSVQVIAARQDAVQFLVRYNLINPFTEIEPGDRVGEKRPRSAEGPSFFSSIVSVDFDRFLSRLSELRQNDSQSIAYVDPMVQYKKHLGIILSSVEALTAMVVWGKHFLERCRVVASEQRTDVPALLRELLESLITTEASTKHIEGLFDRAAAAETTLLIPSPGTSSAFDAATDKLKQIESKLSDTLRQLQKNVFGGAQAHFADLGKDLFLIEVAVKDAPKLTPAGMIERARSAKSVKYVVPSLEPLVMAHKEATALKASALLTVLSSVASRICDEFPRLFLATRALSYIDCLLNLAQLHFRFPTVCYPQLCTSQKTKISVLRGYDMIHPLLVAKNPVANSVTLDDDEGRVLLLTGPNMAGKSTLMRTVATNVLLGQLGGPVLATKMELSPVDRVFTRIGARDASHKGQSTLYVELNETADILHSASARSLCLVDELGRGTSTHDGMAIAYATLHALSAITPAAPLTIFSTHYHALAMEQARTATQTPGDATARVVQLGYMDFVLRSQTATDFVGDNDANDASRSCATGSCVSSVVFLYRLVRGICARSYGVEVALLAGIPDALVQLARERSEALSRETAMHEDVRGIEKFLRD